MCKILAGNSCLLWDRAITCNKETAGIQDEIWHQFGIQNYNGNVLSVYSVGGRDKISPFSAVLSRDFLPTFPINQILWFEPEFSWRRRGKKVERVFFYAWSCGFLSKTTINPIIRKTYNIFGCDFRWKPFLTISQIVNKATNL